MSADKWQAGMSEPWAGPADVPATRVAEHLAGTPMATELREALLLEIAAAARARAAELGREFSAVDFAVGVMVTVSLLSAMGLIPAAVLPNHWHLFIMAGRPIWQSEEEFQEHQSCLAERRQAGTDLKYALQLVNDAHTRMGHCLRGLEDLL